MVFHILTVGLAITACEGISLHTFVLYDHNQVLCPKVHSKRGALKQSSDIALLQSVLIKLREELALSTDALVADVISKMFITFFMLRNITLSLLSDIYFSVLDKLRFFFALMHNISSIS